MYAFEEVKAVISDYQSGRIDAAMLTGNISQAAFLCSGTDYEFCEACVIADVLGGICDLHPPTPQTEPAATRSSESDHRRGPIGQRSPAQ